MLHAVEQLQRQPPPNAGPAAGLPASRHGKRRSDGAGEERLTAATAPTAPPVDQQRARVARRAVASELVQAGDEAATVRRSRAVHGDRIGGQADATAGAMRRRPRDGRDDRSHNHRHDDRGERDHAPARSRSRRARLSLRSRAATRSYAASRSTGATNSARCQFGRQRQQQQRGTGRKREQGTANGEKRRIGRAKAPCGRRQHDGGDEQNQELLGVSQVGLV